MMESAAERAKRLRRATRASARARARATEPRNHKIFLAYCWLTQSPLTTEQTLKALEFLTDLGHGVNAPKDGIGAYLFLARATGLTKQRIWDIVRKIAHAQLTRKD